ncbi:hypothetical protein [Jiella avicenniae]|uniref:Uncharacterized protein n=1 Tax=Jiella avicenniae TaxID=2907202 RepID=A0A9X1TDS3_9HYPH|nr:hypothetical protein [Jiella avicenniae]MCE7030463.1 hypothetical protein [Jiella avicenniae]
MALQEKSGSRPATGTGLFWVDAPELVEDEAFLQRLRAENDALDSLRQALDAESHGFARFLTRDAEEMTGETFADADF